MDDSAVLIKLGHPHPAIASNSRADSGPPIAHKVGCRFIRLVAGT